MTSEVKATGVVFKINGKVFGCQESLTFSTKRAMISVVCAATAGFEKKVPGLESWDGSVNAIMRLFDPADVANNVTLREMYAALRNGALITIEYEIGGAHSDGYVFTSSAYLSEVNINIPAGDDIVKWSATLVGAEPLLLEA